jgi:hypothetical protein
MEYGSGNGVQSRIMAKSGKKNNKKNKIIYFPFYKKYNIIHDRIKCTSHLSLGKIDGMVLL